MNQALLEAHPERTLESIKGQRRSETYRQRVKTYIADIKREREAPPGNNPEVTPDSNISSRDDLSDAILEYIKGLPPPKDTSYRSRQLINITNRASEWGKERSLLELSEYVNAIFPRNETVRRLRPLGTKHPPMTRRRARRMDYAVVQKPWKKYQGRCIREILDGKNTARMPDREIMKPYWRQVFEKP